MHVYLLNYTFQVNSYQATIVTDVIRTYAIFSYMCGEIQWSSLGRNRAAVVGYNSEAIFFENHLLSGLSGVGDAVSCTFDIGRRRKRQGDNMPNNMPMPLPADEEVRRAVASCLRLEARDILVTTETPENLAAMLEPCPCSLYNKLLKIVHDLTNMKIYVNCYVSSNPINLQQPRLGAIALTQTCCYDVNG